MHELVLCGFPWVLRMLSPPPRHCHLSKPLAEDARPAAPSRAMMKCLGTAEQLGSLSKLLGHQARWNAFPVLHNCGVVSSHGRKEPYRSEIAGTAFVAVPGAKAALHCQLSRFFFHPLQRSLSNLRCQLSKGNFWWLQKFQLRQFQVSLSSFSQLRTDACGRPQSKCMSIPLQTPAEDWQSSSLWQ